MITKKPKMISLDTELIERLQKEENSSELINTLLHKHFNNKGHFTLEELETEIKSLHLEVLEKTARANKLKDMKKDLIKKQSIKTPAEVLRDKFGDTASVNEIIYRMENAEQKL